MARKGTLTMNGLKRLSSFVNETTFDQIPSSVREQAKIRVIDLLSAIGLGMRSEVMNPLLHPEKTPSPQEATVLFYGFKAHACHAAACNTFTANSSGMEDGSRFAGAHPSSGIIPPALAAAQMTRVSGSELITAVVLGYELYLRIGYALYPHDLKRGFQPSSILAPLGSATAVGKILRLDSTALRGALGLACLCSGGLAVAFDAYPSKCYQIARGVKGGFEAALLAREGMPGPERALEDGYLKAYGGVESLNLKDLGSPFLLSQTYLKIHGGCRHIHPCIDAVLKLRNEEGIRADEVEEITVHITSMAQRMEREELKSAFDARFNTGFLVAAALREGVVSESQITEDFLQDGGIRALRSKTRVEIDPELDRNFPGQRGAEVWVKTKEGRRVSRKVKFPLGEPENPLSPERVGEKFKRGLTGILDESQISALYGFLQDLENQKNVEPFFRILAGK
jgi:2-methylcitrate dehydratase PrpD